MSSKEPIPDRRSGGSESQGHCSELVDWHQVTRHAATNVELVSRGRRPAVAVQGFAGGPAERGTSRPTNSRWRRHGAVHRARPAPHRLHDPERARFQQRPDREVPRAQRRALIARRLQQGGVRRAAPPHAAGAGGHDRCVGGWEVAHANVLPPRLPATLLRPCDEVDIYSHTRCLTPPLRLIGFLFERPAHCRQLPPDPQSPARLLPFG